MLLIQCYSFLLDVFLVPLLLRYKTIHLISKVVSFMLCV